MAYLGVLVAGLLVYAVLPGDRSRAVLYLTLAATAPLVLFAGIRLHRPPYALPWYLAGAGLGCYFIADLIFYYQDFNRAEGAPVPRARRRLLPGQLPLRHQRAASPDPAEGPRTGHRQPHRCQHHRGERGV